MSDFRIDQITNRVGDAGTQICGVSTFSGTSGMIIPGGSTEFRGGRGRGVFLAGYAAPSYYTSMDYIEIATTGNAADFGDLSIDKNYSGGCASATRGFSIGGWDEPGGNLLSGIEYVTISSKGGASDWGDMWEAAYNVTGFSNSTRGLFGAGYAGPSSDLGPHLNIIQYFQMATTGNSNDFGDLVHKRRLYGNSGSSTTRGFVAGSSDQPGAGSYTNYIDMVTMTTLGNAIDFGNMTTDADSTQGTSDATRLILALGAGPSPLDWGINTINYLTMATKGNASDFGDMNGPVVGSQGTTSNSVRAVFGGGRNNSGNYNTIDYITIQTTGNASDFGDLTSARTVNAAASDAHGGLGS